MYEARESAIDAYSAERRKAIKRIARQMRIEAGFSQQAVATFLGCSRARITSIEREESDTDYSQGELELLATLCGRHPLDIVRLAGQDTIALAEMMTAKLTGRALGRMIDCQLPKQLARLLLIEESPGSIVFSPTGHTMASIVDSDLVEYCEEDEAAEEAYQPTLLCWDTHSGKLLGQVCLPDTGEIVLLDEDRVAITTRASAWEDDGVDVNEERSSLLLWNARSGEIAHITQLPARVRNLAGSQGGEFLAAYMPTITAIQVWRTADWQPAIAYELGISEISGEPGGRLARASDCYDLPRQEKQSPHGLYFGADRFAFLDDHTLVVNFYKRVVELDIRSSSAGYAALLRNLKDFPRVTHMHDEQREITVRSIDYDALASEGESRVQLYYWVPSQQDRSPHEVTVKRRFCGTVQAPMILDEGCILASVSYNTSYPWGRVYKRRVGLVNVISGRIVMLQDQGRLAPGDNQLHGCLSPGGDLAAYWTFPANKGIPRLTLQQIDTAVLRSEGVSLEEELKRSRKRHGESDEAYVRWREDEDALLEKMLGG